MEESLQPLQSNSNGDNHKNGIIIGAKVEGRRVKFGKWFIGLIVSLTILSGILFIVAKGFLGSDSGAMSASDFLQLPQEEVISEFDSLLIQKGKNITEELLQRLNSSDWDFYNKNKYNELVFTGKGRNEDTYKLSGEMPATPEEIVQILFNDYDAVPTWSKDIGQTVLLKQVDPQTQIGYQKTRSIGPISPRDFVTIRQWRYIPEYPDEILIGFQSIEWDLKNLTEISKKGAVRGYIGTSGSWIRPSEVKGHSKIDHLLDLNFNLAFFPFRDTFLINGLEDSFKDLRERIHYLKKKDR